MLDSYQSILVAGGAGFIGAHLVRALLALHKRVTIVDNFHTGRRRNLLACQSDPHLTIITHDITQPLSGDYDLIINLACPASPVHYQSDPIQTLLTSVLGIRNLLELARTNHATLLHASTSEVYGDPLCHPQQEGYWGNVNPIGQRSCYDEGKRAAETLAADYRDQHALDVRLIRIFNTYGPHMQANDGRVVSNFITQALNNEPLTIYGTGNQTRSFQFVDDLVRAILSYLDQPADKIVRFCQDHALRIPVINLGNPHEFTMTQLAELVLQQLPQSTSTITYHPLPSDDPQMRKPDINWAQELLGWEPTISLEVGLAKTIAYFSAIHPSTIK